jgi:anti-anti-sigma factor
MRGLAILENDGIIIVVLNDSSSLNEGQAIGLRQSLYNSLASTENPRVAINLSAIDYISSTGIALLIGTKRRVEAAHGKLVLFGLHPDVHDLFVVMKLVNLFDLVDDEAQALELLSPPRSH